MRKLLKYLKGYEKETILGPLFKLIEAVFELAVPLVVANIIILIAKMKFGLCRYF